MRQPCYSRCSRQASRMPCALNKDRCFKHLTSTAVRCHKSTYSAAVAAKQQGPVLVHDGVAVAAPASPQQLLAEHRRWSYTTALVRKRSLLVDWHLHLERLVRNIQLLAEQRPPVYAELLAWIQEHASQDSACSLLDGIVRPQVAQALQLLAEGQQQQQQGDCMVTVLITDCQTSTESTAAVAGAAPLSVYVWAKHLPPSRGPVQAAKVLVAGDPRAVAQAKHCDWVVARQPLEQLKQAAGADEVVLSDSTGALLEGLVSNWYVIADEAALTAAQGGTGAYAAYQTERVSSPAGVLPPSSSERAGGSSSSSGGARGAGLVLLTTGAVHAALPGISQKRVLEACEQIGLKVVEQPVQLAHHAAWREAFISNCVKGIQPVASVQTASELVWSMPSSDGSVTQLLQQAMLQLQQTIDVVIES